MHGNIKDPTAKTILRKKNRTQGIRYIYIYIYIYIYMSHNVILLSHKKEWNSAICNKMDGVRRYYAKWNKSEKDKYCITLICGL